MNKESKKQEFSAMGSAILPLSGLFIILALLAPQIITSTAGQAESCLLMNLTSTLPFRCSRHMLNESLQLDEASLTFVSRYKKHIRVYANWQVCDKCPCINFTDVRPSQNVTCRVDTSFDLYVKITAAENNSDILCRQKLHLEEHGYYQLWLDPDGDNGSCSFIIDSKPLTANLPIYVLMGVIFVVILLWAIIKCLLRRGHLSHLAVCFPYTRLVSTDLGEPTGLVNGETDTANESTRQRLKSLDTFRGISLVVMIFVNYGGGSYWFFSHSAWNGLTVADLVFPWFTFIMGTSIALAFKKEVDRGARVRDLILKILRRSVILFVIGVMISNSSHNYVNFKELRILGVLQRLALTYFIVATVVGVWSARVDWVELGQGRWWYLSEVTSFWPEWLTMFSMLALHLGLLLGLHVPGCPRGYIGPGGLHDNGQFVNCTGGAAAYIDKVVLGENHIYRHPTCREVYQTNVPYDPEGILGTFTSIVICFFGVFAGKIILLRNRHSSRIIRWLILAVITGVAAGILCRFSQNDGWIPVNKNFWSVSFVLALSSMAYVLLSVCYFLVDVTMIWSGAPFIYPGMNSILVYICHEVFESYCFIQFYVPQTHAALLARNVYGVAVWTIMAAILYYKKIFIAI